MKLEELTAQVRKIMENPKISQRTIATTLRLVRAEIEAGNGKCFIPMVGTFVKQEAKGKTPARTVYHPMKPKAAGQSGAKGQGKAKGN